MITPLRDLGRRGIIVDVPEYDLPPNVFSGGQNVRFEDGVVKSFPGNSTFATPSVTPYFVLAYPTATEFLWIYMGTGKAYLFDGTTHTNITRTTIGDYTGISTDRWSGVVYGGIPCLTNDVDGPQYYNGTRLADMIWTGSTTWETQGVTTKVLRAHKYHLIALYPTISSTGYPHRVMWSSPAEAGSMPDWDYTDAAEDAGFNDLSDTAGAVVDGASLREDFIVYKEDSAYRMVYNGSGTVWDWYRIVDVPGMLAQGCVVEVKGRHIVLGPGDLYWTDGQSWDSLADDRVKEALFSAINPDGMANCFMQHFPARDEVWVCYPIDAETFPNRALVYNYRHDTFTFRELPANTSSMALGSLSSGALTISALDWTIDSWTSVIAARDYSPAAYSLVSTSDDLQQYEDGNTFDGSNVVCYAETASLNLGDLGSLQTVTRLYPRMTDTNHTVNFYIGSQYQPSDSVKWSGPYTYNAMSDRKVDCLVTGNFHKIKIQTEADVAWQLSGIDVEHEFAGER